MDDWKSIDDGATRIRSNIINKNRDLGYSLAAECIKSFPEGYKFAYIEAIENEANIEIITVFEREEK